MKMTWSVASALALVVALSAANSARAADPRFSDIICPNATEPVRQFDTVKYTAQKRVDEVLAAGNRVIAAYETCANEKQSQIEVTNGHNNSLQLSSDYGIEAVHYAKLRGAQYYVVMGRLHRILDDFDAARLAFTTAIAQVKDTIDWRTSPQAYYRSNDVNVGSASAHLAAGELSSKYHDQAIAIRDSANEELAKLPPPSGANPTPAPTP